MISVDFIVKLPKSAGFDMVMTIMDLVSKNYVLYFNLYYSKYRKSGQTLSTPHLETL